MGGMRQLNFKSCVQDKKFLFTIRPWIVYDQQDTCQEHN